MALHDVHFGWAKWQRALAGQLPSVLVVSVLALGWADRSAVAADTEAPPLPPAADVQIDYQAHIQPIFADHCYRCHGPERQRSNFRLDRSDVLLRGGNSGEPAVIPGNSGESHLIRLVAGLEPNFAMPPDREPLSDQQIALLRAWIDQGAPSTTSDAEPEEFTTQLWSLQPLNDVAVPEAEEPWSAEQPWSANPIDRFILQKLSEAGFEPSEPADRRTLIRRLYLVMHGLPPTPEQVEAFISDNRPDAYERLVDEVLASERYGERWAQHWLDVVRFAETHGFETNVDRPNAWHYRDWVIEAFNDDLPYDRFIYKQIAGDALGVHEATGFLVAGAHDIVLSPDMGLTLMQRHEELADIVDTTGTAMLGLTLNCARCHNHMFDPVTQADFYSLQAVFAGVRHGERNIPPNEEAGRQVDELARKTASLQQQRDALVPHDVPELELRDPVHARHNEERFEPVTARFVRFTIDATNTGTEPCIDELEIWTATTDGGEARNVALASEGGIATASGSLEGSDIHKLEHINNGRYGNSQSWISSTPGGGWVQIELAEPFVIDRITWARDREGQFDDRLPIDYRLDVGLEEGQWLAVAGSQDRLPHDADRTAILAEYLEPDQAERYTELTEQIDELQQQRDRLLDGPLAYLGRFEQPEPTRRKYRGDPQAPREVVAPASLSALDGIDGLNRFNLPADAPERQRREALARWIASPDNPLTPRVMVNRIWHYTFGTGLVSTPSDFGAAGAEPSHPELLDWLAQTFIDSGWSIKEMHRRVVTSQTFRQSSRPDSAALARDADARLLWRYPPRRGEGELIRDSILQVSGTLDPARGGPSYNPFVPNDNYVRVWKPLEEFGPEQMRRMIYRLRVRMEPEGVFGAFDMPDMAQACASRTESTTALQALNLFNSYFMIQQAQHFADRLRDEAGDDPARQVRRAFHLTLSRDPDDYELHGSIELIADHSLEAFTRAMLNLSEFIDIP